MDESPSWRNNNSRSSVRIRVAGTRIAILRLEAQLRREFCIAAVDPRDVAAIEGPIRAFVGRHRPGQKFIPARAHAEKEAPEAFDHAVAGGGGVAFALI